MAGWKEKGEVPDSEDEDVGSLSGTDEGFVDGVLGLAEGRKILCHSLLENGRDGVGSTHLVTSQQDSQFDPEFPLPRAANRPDSPSQSPQVFRAPPAFLEFEEWSRTQLENPQNHLDVDDEISRSYVTLSSPLSSLSSLPRGHDFEGIIQKDNSAENETELAEPPAGWSLEDSRLMEDPEVVAWTNRRSLRQRNLIQLHPYALEGEKYRRTLMARGMRPLRLTQMQEEARKITSEQASPDPEFVSEEESQMPLLEEELHSSQPSSQLSDKEDDAKITLSSIENTPTRLSDDDEELPDIDELLSRRNLNSSGRSAKRRKTTYIDHSRLRLPLATIPPPNLRQKVSTTLAEGRNKPPSPPATSPLDPSRLPIHSSSKRPRSSGRVPNRATSVEHTDPDQDTRTGSLPTPATGTAKHTIDLTADDVSEDDQSDLASDSEGVSPSSELEKSVQVRRVGKRIRGVLPASWLRLDQQTRKPEEPKAKRRDHRSLSPVRTISRRGVAIPKDVTDEGSPIVNSREATDYFFLPDDSQEDDESELLGYVEESTLDLGTGVLSSMMDVDSVLEDNRIDIMAPSRKRQMKLLTDGPPGKKRHVSTSLFRYSRYGRDHQPKITEHMPKLSNGENRKQGQHVRRKRPDKFKARLEASRSRGNDRTAPPKLSILDVVSSTNDQRERLPPFIRIAARNARSRKGLGRQSPTRKFVKLATREDTQDALSILHDWREGIIHPRVEAATANSNLPAIGTSRGDEETEQMLTPPSFRDIFINSARVSTKPVKLIITKTGTTDVSGTPGPAKKYGRQSNLHPRPGKRKSIVSAPTSILRPAQLETSLLEYSHRHPSVAFGSTKKALDRLYKRAHKGSALRDDVQLNRFLLDDAVYKQTTPQPTSGEDTSSKVVSASERTPFQLRRRQKQTPRRIDAGAAVFRQPSEPLVLDILQQVAQTRNPFESDGKLIGLGSYGTNYTYHFDIFPLHRGVFFHSSTFVGSGRLSRALGLSSSRDLDTNRGHIFLQLAGKQIRWGLWNGDVSSELGVCFDWILEKLDICAHNSSEVDTNAALDCLTFIIDYIQGYLSFPDPSNRQECLLRFLELLPTFVERLRLTASSLSLENTQGFRLLVEVSAQITVLIFQLIKVSLMKAPQIDLTRRLEALLEGAAATTIQVLLLIGLVPVRSLYDDLQYLAAREAGIKPNRYVAQAWVMIIHALQAAQIPRSSFWHVLNSQVIRNHESEFNDARVMERVWYLMFSILPLFEFDLDGVVVPGLRLSKSPENWQLPQRMAKKIFELYTTKSRQLPGFNDYCRAFFNRCSYLMQSWDWHRHGAIVGVLFDFFATQKLAHLRNEEAYQSPRFLAELDRDPTLSVEPEDRCFHILLKIIATSIKQMRAVEDMKGIRNLITRVLPNHDRQYPKEETIHQRDLASLRNHHDLLCTLFWAAPQELRPPLALLRELVNPESSHREAYLINLRAWEILTRFILASTPTTDAYLPLGTWQYESFMQLIKQYQSVERDVEEQLVLLPTAAKQLISQNTVTQTIQQNKNQIGVAILQHLTSLQICLKEAEELDKMKVMFLGPQCKSTLIKALHMFNPSQKSDVLVLEKALEIIQIYVVQLNRVALSKFSTAQDSPHEDSQDYGSSSFERDFFSIEYIGELNGELLSAVGDHLRLSLRSAVPTDGQYLDKLVETWALIVGAVILCECTDSSEFLSDTGTYNELRMDDKARKVRNYASFFLAKLVEITEGRIDFQAAQRDILSDWLCLLVKPVECLQYEHVLLLPFTRYEPIIELAWNTARTQRTGDLANTIDSIIEHRTIVIKAIFREMHSTLLQEPLTKARYQCILQRIMMTIKRDFLDMEPGSREAKLHQLFVGEVLGEITTYFRDLCPIDDFFKTNTVYPTQSEFQVSVATLRSYALRLQSERGKSEFNHYCFAALKLAAVEGKLESIRDELHNAMGDGQQPWKLLTYHVLTFLTPSFIHAGFIADSGWLLAKPFLEAAGYQLDDIADADMSGAFDGARATVHAIVDGLKALSATYSRIADLQVAHETTYLLLIVTRFMSSTLEWLKFVMDQLEEDYQRIMDDLACFNDFAVSTRRLLTSSLEDNLAHGNLIFQSLRHLASTHEQLRAIPPRCVPEFSGAILSDIQQNWDKDSTDSTVRIKFGWEMRAAQSMWQTAGDVDQLYGELDKQLGLFIFRYHRLRTSPDVYNKEGRHLAGGFDWMF